MFGITEKFIYGNIAYTEKVRPFVQGSEGDGKNNFFVMLRIFAPLRPRISGKPTINISAENKGVKER